MPTYDISLYDADSGTNFTVFTGRPDSLCDACDQPTDGHPMLSISDLTSAPEYITHLRCYLAAAHAAATADI